MGAKSVTDANFVSEVLQSPTPVLVDFWAEWCAPCRRIEPLLSEIATEMAGKVEVARLNIDESPETAMAYRVMSVPTLTVFVGGKPVQSIAGARSKSDLVRFVESALESVGPT